MRIRMLVFLADRFYVKAQSLRLEWLLHIFASYCTPKPFYGVIRFGSRGKRDVFLMLSRPRYNMVTLSKPIPPPA